MNWPRNSADNEMPSPLSGDDIANLNREFADLDKQLGFEIGDDFEQFNQMNDIFTRAFWDETIRTDHTEGFFNSYRMEFVSRRGEGFAQKDFALRNAAWSVSDIISDRGSEKGRREGFQAPIAYDTPVAPEQIEITDAAAETEEIKRIAKLFGADLVGIAEVDPRLHYSARVDTRDLTPANNDLPQGITHVIVMGHAMDAELVDTYPSALAGASTGLEYSHEAAIAIQLSSYIRNLGFEAVASMNDTALVVPYAIKAGLGEYGRNQMVLTPEYGPRVRFSKIFTSMPLIANQPKAIGIHDYCKICTKCATACPPKALPFGEPTAAGENQSTIKGVTKWSANCEKCFGYWAKLKTDCAICMRVCPFNKGDGWLDSLWFKLATSKWRKVALWLDNTRGTSDRLKPRDWWARLRGK